MKYFLFSTIFGVLAF